MKSNELRIGNLILIAYAGIEGKEWRIYPTKISDIIDIEWHPDDYRPIPLTNEWLVKLGFKWSDKYCLWTIENPLYFPLRSDFSLVIFRRGIKIKPDYVHELQNLYFALTGEELTIKE